ncbi:DUF6475 domain-containing protein [Paraburkholderia sp. DGU8]|uniref:DUF6475 domain-containing protein n=1 Tax=Paraburkholderia sp. DGU8 TaxID=3161997 RepID=UPI003465D026
MQTTDAPKLVELVSGVYAFYRQDFSKFAASVWVNAVQPFDFEAVADALNRHCVNPDSGQFVPKPADIVKMLQGSTQDSALGAWARVDRAVRSCGTYESVVFDDALIHRVITEMGGWVLIGAKGEDEWPYVRNEFVNRYRGYKMRGETPDYLPVLVGIAEAHNCRMGHESDPPVLVGDAAKARRVMSAGDDKPVLGFTRMAVADAAPRPVSMLAPVP